MTQKNLALQPSGYLALLDEVEDDLCVATYLYVLKGGTKMDRYNRIFSYLDYLAAEDSKVGSVMQGNLNKAQVLYSCDFVSFIGEVYKTDLPDPEYLESHLPADSKPEDYIEKADLRLLRAILTYCLRQERFCEGYWLEAFREGYFLRILSSVKEKWESRVVI